MLVKYLRALLKSSFRHERKLNPNGYVDISVTMSGTDGKVTSPVDGVMNIHMHKEDVDSNTYCWLSYRGNYVGSYSFIGKDSGGVGTAQIDVSKGQEITLYGFFGASNLQARFIPYID